jgi:3-deoxy-manno-octulosonate cytidylyltransferase (CMP-KDO synthetase)
MESRDAGDPNRVKVVLNRKGEALYFSRAPIPASTQSSTQSSTTGGTADGMLQHIGLYAYRPEFLARFVGLARGRAELAEGLEQLRALEHGYTIAVGIVEGWQSLGVDSPADIPRVEAIMAARSKSANTD